MVSCRAWGFLCVLLGLQGCQTQPQRIADTATHYLRGAVSFQDDTFYLTPCFSQERRILNDATGALRNRFQEQQSASEPVPVYMELLAQQQTDLSWRVHTINLVGGSNQSCQNDLNSIAYRAGGNDPLWMADVLETGVRVQLYQELKTITVPFSEPPTERLTWAGEVDGTRGRNYDVKLSLTEFSCRDGAGIWYRWQAEMTLNNTLYTGCARAGSIGSQAAAGRYSTVLSDQTAFVVMDLLTSGKTRLVLDHRNGQPLSVLEGEWRWQDSSKVLLTLTLQDGQPYNSLILLKSTPYGFVQDGFSNEFGRAGIQLQRSE